MRNVPLTAVQLALLAMALQAVGARADDAQVPVFSFSGFGTLGVVHSSERNADFLGTSLEPEGAGYSRAWSPKVDSLLGAQVSARLRPGLSAVLQVISEQNYDGTWRPHVEWVNVKYEFTPDLSARVGRTVLPAFAVADSRKVGFAIPWVRPPVEVYAVVPVTNNDGVDMSYRMAAGEATGTFQLTAGQSDTKFPSFNGAGSGTVKARDLVTVVGTFEQGFTTARVSAGHARITVPEVGPLFDGFRAFGPPGEAIAEKYDLNSKPITFLGFGATYDPGPWFVTAEWSRIETKSFLGNKSGWYASAGYRAGRFTPYATVAQARAGSLSDPGLDTAFLPPSLAGPAAGLNAALNSLLARNVSQDTVSVGVRWDFIRNAALKLQYDEIRIHAPSTGSQGNIQPQFQPGGRLRLFSATLDFMFR